jgi:glutamate racemase
LPNEDLIYFGDTAHLPYGDKSKETVTKYALSIQEFLLAKNCKAIVIACNTASAFAFEALKKAAPIHFPIFNVIDPMAKKVCREFNHQKIGVIGTKGTIGSGIYQQRVNAISPSIQVVSKATSLLAPLVEENFDHSQLSQLVLAEYLNVKDFESIQALVLGCTHYPLLKDDISAVLPSHVSILDSSEVIATELQTYLTQKDLLNPIKKGDQFFISDYTPAFEEMAKHFFGENISLNQISL